MEGRHPPDLDWTEDEEARLEALLRNQYGGETLSEFILRVSPRHPPLRHMQPVIDLWERTRSERVFACVELPPRHAKTTTGLHALAWRICRDPVLRHGFATFGDDYAASRSRIARMMVRAGGKTLSKEMANLHEWVVQEGGGGLVSRGYMSEWTGKGIDGVALVDDPMKDRAAAESAKIRENIWEWFGDVLWTRLEPGSSVIVQHTRWHDDDLIGRLMKGSFSGYKFERIRLPAICEDADDIIGRQIGEALWPERFPADELAKIENSIGPYSWASLYQQRPRPKGADVFGDPARFSLAAWRPDGHRILICADPAASENTRADHSALFVLAAKEYGEDMLIDILYGWRGHVGVPALARKLVETSRLFWNAPVVVEAVGGFKSVPQTMKEIEPSLRIRIARMGDPTVGDGPEAAARVTNTSVNKFLRSQPAAAAWNKGRIRVPIDAERMWNPQTSRFEMPAVILRLRPGVAPGITWADELINEAKNFTGVQDPEDDQIDGLAHGFNELMSARSRPKGQQRNRLPFG